MASVGGVINPKKKRKAKFPKVDESKASTEVQEEHEDIMMEERQNEMPTKSVEIRDVRSKRVPPFQKEVVKRHIEEMIFEMPDIPYSIFNPNVVKVDEIPSFRRKKEEPAEVEKTYVNIQAELDTEVGIDGFTKYVYLEAVMPHEAVNKSLWRSHQIFKIKANISL